MKNDINRVNSTIVTRINLFGPKLASLWNICPGPMMPLTFPSKLPITLFPITK